ncbi:hypothetical protein DERP_002693 [Dermatophagoides pteronyssinus]|uniref:Uncharacterized protein n=1 Tax=Dermatophagoides pteronyssinus TaxID=6956 RepID=A0ABQ8JVD6_DERPT|nr:hypothetical protein DERP_002693 [Dermatophagoides pteronyssinus]
MYSKILFWNCIGASLIIVMAIYCQASPDLSKYEILQMDDFEDFLEILNKLEGEISEKINSTKLIYRILKPIIIFIHETNDESQYETELLMGSTNCTKQNMKNFNDCQFIGKGEYLYCDAEIVENSINFTNQLNHIECKDNPYYLSKKMKQ